MSETSESQDAFENEASVESNRRMGRRAALLAAGTALFAVACDDSQNAGDFGPLVGGDESGAEGSDAPEALGFIVDEEVPAGEGVAAPTPPVAQREGDAPIVDSSLVRPVREDTAPLANGDGRRAGPNLPGRLTLDPFDVDPAGNGGATTTTTTAAPTTTSTAAPTTTSTAAPTTTTAAPTTTTTAAPTTTTTIAQTTTTTAAVATTIANQTSTTTTTAAPTTTTTAAPTTTTTAAPTTTTTVAPTTTTAAPTTTTTAAPTTTTAAPTTTTTAAPTTTTTAAPTTTTTEAPPTGPLLSEARLLASRMTFAPTPQTDQQILELGLEGFIDRQLSLNTPDPAVENRMNGYLTRNPNITQLYNNYSGNERQYDHEIVHASVLRAAYSEHQLFEVLQRLWMDHFNATRGGDWYWSAHYSEQVLRPNGMGRFHDLLVATANSPLMMVYLDNAISHRNGINENYGRELLELHTLGIDDDGNQIYTEDDVVGVSHVMTGWSIDWDTRTFLYRPDSHSDQAVSILGGQWTNAGLSGKAAGDSLLNFLSHHPQTARYISTKLIRRFVTDTPPESLIASAAAVYLANDTNVVPVLRHILGSAEFANSAGEKIRRPFEQIIAAARALGVELSNGAEDGGAERMHDYLENVSHLPWRHGPPDGFPDIAEPWLSSTVLLARWEGGARLSRNNWVSDDTMAYDQAILRGATTNAGELFDRLALRLNIGELGADTRAAVLAIVGISEDTPIDDVSDNEFTDLLSYLTAHPLFQLR